jgi:hypothetical protein
VEADSCILVLVVKLAKEGRLAPTLEKLLPLDLGVSTAPPCRAESTVVECADVSMRAQPVSLNGLNEVLHCDGDDLP